MKSFYKYLILLFCLLQIVISHGIDHLDDDEDEHDHEEHNEKEEEKDYASYVTIIGILAVLVCSATGTILPIVFKNKPFFKEDTIFFGSIKLFGTGIILGVAFIHMLSPANELLTSKYTYSLFNEKYTSFAGAFAIVGILITHFVQVYASHFLEGNHKHDHIHVHSTSDCNSSKSLKHEKSEIIKLEEGDISTVHFSSGNLSKNNSKEFDMNSKEWHEKNNKVSLVPADDCVANQHEIMHLLEKKEKQLVCYLLEIGISFHSVLIGVAFGLERHGLIILMIALMFHQFFEGVSLSSIFIEAHFKHIRSIIFMIILYSLTMPIGGIIGLILRSIIEETSKVYCTLQGIIDSIAAGILIYDILVNILSRHCTSCNWKNTSFIGKNIQLFAFYIGLFIIALIGVWA
ncbi:Zinc/iron permease [Piromyces finnis]|uniref:Zinc/iron permease n=1 Tax=Piromyces finnis TaxID=1754191 RepID=A0A1Y1V6F7_9FUNG|nr:Zinc/iron permease [Piromyces finnis]|eukprot:ORX48363.1 Zinc/iron permease [Piromyces finnis]